jgi:hypothetical protein
MSLLCVQASLPQSVRGARSVTVQPGSGATVRPLWAAGGGAVREGCRLEIQLNVDFHMRIIPAPLLGFLLKVRRARFTPRACITASLCMHGRCSDLNTRCCCGSR